MNKQIIVGEFHAKHGFDVGLDLGRVHDNKLAYDRLVYLSALLRDESSKIESGRVDGKGEYDPRVMRVHLMLEELGELVLSLANRDPVKTLDGLADLDYVVNGCAITFGLPLDVAFREVHRSNMTKAVRQPGVDDPRLRNKGASYSPPDLEIVIKAQEHFNLEDKLTVAHDASGAIVVEYHSLDGIKREGDAAVTVWSSFSTKVTSGDPVQMLDRLCDASGIRFIDCVSNQVPQTSQTS